ncbi:MAG TPA: radical SAM protein [Candidatus Hydrogenedens sp.]|nr:radical SAM protein [Candidatus Hydrogenedens sp.]
MMMDNGAQEAGKLVLYGWDNLSTNDGPGVCLALYFKGCSLRCPWCLNPYLQKIKPEIRWKRAKCDYDGICVKSCSQNAIQNIEDTIVVDEEVCSFCGICWETCKQEALKPAGDYISIEQIISLVEYEINLQIPPRNVTISGGEPLSQGFTLIHLLERLKPHGVHLTLKTCAGIINRELWNAALELTDSIFLQIFTIDKQVWESVSKTPFDTYLQNLYELALSEKPIYIRIPIVPGFSDSPETINNLCQFIKHSLPSTQQTELRGYAPTSSYTNPLFSFRNRTITPEEVMKLCSLAKGVGLEQTHWRGSLRIIDESQISHYFPDLTKDI